MKEKRILDALNDIDERFIEDAAPGKRRGPRKPLYTRFVTAAALVLLLTGALFWAKGRFGRAGSVSGDAETPVTQTTEAMSMPESREEIIPETGAPSTEAAPVTDDAESPTEADSIPEEAVWTTAAAQLPTEATQATAAQTTTAAQSPTEAEATEATEATQATETIQTTEAAQTTEATAAIDPEDGPSIKAGTPAGELFAWYGLPENCTSIGVGEGSPADCDESSRIIDDPDLIVKIIELLSPGKCTDKLDHTVEEGDPLNVRFFLQDGSSTDLTLYDCSFTCGGYDFSISEDRSALVRTYLEQ